MEVNYKQVFNTDFVSNLNYKSPEELRDAVSYKQVCTGTTYILFMSNISNCKAYLLQTTSDIFHGIDKPDIPNIYRFL